MNHQGTKPLKSDRLILRQFRIEDAEAMFEDWAGDAPIGSINVVYKNDAVKMIHIGYCIGKKWWRLGIASEALSVLIQYFFNEVGANRIEARHDPRNPNSGQVMLKCGMKYEGTMREAGCNNQGICDDSMYAVLRKDFGHLRYTC